MIYPYQRVRRPGVSRRVPLVHITVHYNGASVLVNALVDSGADHNIFGKEVADGIGLNIGDEAPVLLSGFDGREAEGFLVPVELQFGEYRWAAPVIFSEASRSRAVVGRVGFFKFFLINFNEKNSWMDIIWNDHSSP
jgi:hypothetical protein